LKHRERIDVQRQEENVNESSRVALATIIGATIGGLFGCLYFTERGRRFRDQIEPRLDDFIGELRRMQGTVHKARTAAEEGWRSLNELAGGAEPRWDTAGGRQMPH
jgi:hypothetical protein